MSRFNKRSRYDSVGAKIKAVRHNHGLTQVQVAERIGFSRYLMTAWENSTTIPPIYSLQVFANHFGYTMAEFFSDILLEGEEQL